MFTVYWTTDGMEFDVNDLVVIEKGSNVSYHKEPYLCTKEFFFYEHALKFIYEHIICSQYIRHNGKQIEVHFSDISTYLTTSEIEYIVKKNYPEDYI